MEAEADTVAQYAPLAALIARRMARHFDRARDLDDLTQEALIAVVTASRIFDESRGVPFQQFAALVIKRRLVEVLRRPKYKPLPQCGEVSLADISDSGPDPSVATDAETILAMLEPRKAGIVRGWMAGDTDAEQAERLGVTRQAVTKIRAGAIEALTNAVSGPS